MDIGETVYFIHEIYIYVVEGVNSILTFLHLYLLYVTRFEFEYALSPLPDLPRLLEGYKQHPPLKQDK